LAKEVAIPDDRDVLIDRLKTHLTEQRYNPGVIHNQCRGAEHFLEYLAQRGVAVDSATPDHVASYLYNHSKVPPASSLIFS